MKHIILINFICLFAALFFIVAEAQADDLPPAIISVDGHPAPKDIMMDDETPSETFCDYSEFIGLSPEKAKKSERFDGLFVRVLRHDEAVTMEYREDRVNFILDKDNSLIANVTCG
ncbi:MAG: I78 family peptidase inhibitor [Pseudomonadota bacterium]